MTERMQENLAKSGAITNTVFELKLAWMRARHPEFSEEEAERQIGLEILRRKERSWMLPVD